MNLDRSEAPGCFLKIGFDKIANSHVEAARYGGEILLLAQKCLFVGAKLAEITVELDARAIKHLQGGLRGKVCCLWGDCAEEF